MQEPNMLMGKLLRALLASTNYAFLSFALCGAATSNVEAFDASYDAAENPAAIRFVSSDHSVCIRSDFRGGRLVRCVEIGPDAFDLLIQPEQSPINDSAWYAFQIYATKPATVSLRLRYEDGTHRYRPLISDDRTDWRPIADHRVSVHPRNEQAVIRLRVGPRPVWVSAQELLTEDEMTHWSELLQQHSFVRQIEIGRSVEGRPIHQLEISETQSGNSDELGHVFIMARQHPPEVSGAIGMMRFVEAIASDTPLAKRFRNRFATIVVPTSNPDGVANGHWRCNANGVDLNRDWGPFQQPETRAIGQSILDIRSLGRRSLHLVLDFHSTHEDVFYTAENVDEAFPKGFTTGWFKAIQRRFPDYHVVHDATHNDHRTTSKAWVHESLDVAAVTYEFGDNTNRRQIAELAVGSAEEMMRRLLQTKENGITGTQLIGLQPVH